MQWKAQQNYVLNFKTEKKVALHNSCRREQLLKQRAENFLDDVKCSCLLSMETDNIAIFVRCGANVTLITPLSDERNTLPQGL